MDPIGLGAVGKSSAMVINHIHKTAVIATGRLYTIFALFLQQKLRRETYQYSKMKWATFKGLTAKTSCGYRDGISDILAYNADREYGASGCWTSECEKPKNASDRCRETNTVDRCSGIRIDAIEKTRKWESTITGETEIRLKVRRC